MKLRSIQKNTGTSLRQVFILALAFLFVGNAHAQFGDINFSRGVELYQQGAYKQGISVFEDIINENKNNIDAYVYLASCYLGIQQYEQVAQTAQQGLKIAPGHIRLMLLEAEAYYRTDYKKAIPIYQQVAELLKSDGNQQNSGIDANQIKSYLGHLYQRSVNELYQTGDFDSAIKEYKKALSASPDSMDIHNNLAYTLLQQERWDEAVSVLEKATEKFPDSEQLLFMKGQAYRGAKNPQKMVDVYEELYKRDKENLNYAIIYGQSLMAANRAQEANAFLNKLLADNPKEESLYEVLKKMNEQRFDFQAKRNILELQRKAFPEDAGVAQELAETNIQIKQYKNARQIYDSLAVATKDVKYHLASARTWLYAENYQKADSVYQSLVQSYSGVEQVLIEASKVAERIGDNDRALDLLKKAYSLEENPEAALDIARLSAGLNNGETLHFAEKLKHTDYSGIGILYEMKYSERRDEVNSSTVALSLVKMLQLYESRQQKISKKADQTLQTMQIGPPPLFHESQRLKQFSYHVDEWYNHVVQNFSTQQSLGILDRVRSIYSESPRLHLFEGKLLLLNEKPDLARNSFQEAARQNTNNPEVFYLLGEANRKLNDFPQAILSYERALTVEPNYEIAYKKIIQTSEQQGSLNALCDRWLQRYSNSNNNNLLREYLILALHKADRKEDAARVVNER